MSTTPADEVTPSGWMGAVEKRMPQLCAILLLFFLPLSFATLTIYPSVNQDDAHFAQAPQTLWEDGWPHLRFNLYSTVQTRAP